ncbi:aluminum-activated malate transporter 9-like [Magnolia sinica]|uniref:aluminum-activated malate transporter 9-like n=1 Tax=Magnolia sinica TaxID=86752 RepID=UPI00265943DD|nr:aluminum-activated malate transporter 9-like [Magnolia sinica]
MNGKKGSIKIDIYMASDLQRSKSAKKVGHAGFSFKRWTQSLWEFAKEDRNRVIFSMKVGLSVVLVSLLILIRAPYHIFGTNIIWSILTVAIMFEYTVGATFNRGFNRALGSVFAGIIAIAVIQVIMYTGRVAEPIIIGFSIFMIGALTSFLKQWPSLVPYEYGFRVTLFTFCLIIISGYRIGNPLRTAIERLYSIAIGGIVAVLVNVLVFPIWAGEQLHSELVKSFDSVADSLEECVRKYLKDDGSDQPEFSKTVDDDFSDEPAFHQCRSTLNSSAKLESLASSAKWEPPHGRFWQFLYPWSEYVKVGAVLRHCAYEVMALHGVLHSEIQAPYNLRITFESEIRDASSKAAALVRSLSKDIHTMKHTLQTSLLKSVHISTERLQRSIDMHYSYLLTAGHDLDLLSKPTPIKHSTTLGDSGEQELPLNTPPPSTAIAPVAPTESYHEIMRKQQRRLHSWPSREVDEFEEEGGITTSLVPKMRALESTTALSLATFTSLLIEFVARLDHLVEAVDELARMANFKNEGIDQELIPSS